jgi:hypothetical protein
MSSSFETVQLYEQFETYSTRPPKPIPYDAKRINNKLYFNIYFLTFFLNRSRFLYFYIWNNWFT